MHHLEQNKIDILGREVKMLLDPHIFMTEKDAEQFPKCGCCNETMWHLAKSKHQKHDSMPMSSKPKDQAENKNGTCENKEKRSSLPDEQKTVITYHSFHKQFQKCINCYS